jgi:hypothetical protein
VIFVLKTDILEKMKNVNTRTAMLMDAQQDVNIEEKK